MLSETNNGPTCAPETAILISTYEDFDHVHAVSNINFNAVSHDIVYDANGNMTDGYDFTNSGQVATRTITYNADNMPVSVVLSPGGTTSLIYDGESKRAKKTASGNTTYYIDEHYEVKNGVSTKFVFVGNIRLAKITGSDRHYFHKDHLGSSTAMSNQSGAQVEASEYLPFGGMRVHTGTAVTDYKFTDQELDTSTNLYNYDARMYDPMVARFISPDSIVQDWYDPQSLNRYSYCLNNPLNYIDPSGHLRISFGGMSMGIGIYGELSFGLPKIGSIPVDQAVKELGDFLDWFNSFFDPKKDNPSEIDPKDDINGPSDPVSQNDNKDSKNDDQPKGTP